MIRVGISIPGENAVGTVLKNCSMSCQSCGVVCDEIYMGTSINGRGRIGDDIWNIVIVVAVSVAISGTDRLF
jgi:hypothetical protein